MKEAVQLLELLNRLEESQARVNRILRDVATIIILEQSNAEVDPMTERFTKNNNQHTDNCTVSSNQKKKTINTIPVLSKICILPFFSYISFMCK